MVSCNNKLIKQYDTKHMLIGENNRGHFGSMGTTQVAGWEIDVTHTRARAYMGFSTQYFGKKGQTFF